MIEGHPKDKDTAYRFLERLDSEKHFTFQTFGDCQNNDSQLIRVLHGSLEEHFQGLVDLNKRGAGVFVTINRTDSKGRKTKNITEIRAVFVDLDGAPLAPVRSFGLRPHIIVQSSPDRWHAYWLCSKLPLEDFNGIQKNIAHRFGGDNSIVDLPRVMRVPGFQHLKREPFLVQIEQLDDFEPYEAAEIRHWLGNAGYPSKGTKEIAGRNSYLFSRACSMRRSGMADSEICEAIIAINQIADLKSSPNFSKGPLDANEVAAICKSAMSERYAPVQGGFKDTLYLISENQLVRRERTSKGQRDIVLCNFTAEIVEDICRDDGAGEIREYQLKAKLHSGEPLPSVTLPASNFNSMGWVPDAFGARASIKVGMANQQHTAAAIQYLSSPLQRRIYTHTGWREINGRWHFLHGAGAITASGCVSSIEVDLGRGLLNYQLPDLQSGDKQAAIRASIALLDIAPDHIIWPLLASVFRSVLSEWLPAELSVFVVGPTGTFKTCLAAVCTSYFGKGWTGSNTPASWSSTANALERMAFTAKDHMLLIDDFAPNGTSTDINKLHATAERVIRAQGNQAGRFRMRADSTLAGSLPPRGLIVATGEDLPRGQSLQARLVVVQIATGDIDVPRLTEAQTSGENGTYALVMAAFTQRLARLADAGGLSGRLDTRRKELRAEAIRGNHTRMPDNIASLMVGVEEFLNYSLEAGAISKRERTQLLSGAWVALSKQANMQASQVAGTDPASRFVSLIAATVSAKSAHIEGIKGVTPVCATALGWDHRGPDPHTYLSANGPTIGWIEGDDLYLEPETAMACAKRLGREQGNELPFSDRRIHKALHEAGLLKSTEPDRNTVRKQTHVGRKYLLHLSAETVFGFSPSSNASPPNPVELNDEDLPF